MPRADIDLTNSRILIVDDTPANIDVLVDVLESEGYDLSVATDGSAALQIASQAEPDLILLDVMMPGIDGFETCRRLKAQEGHEDVPVIFVTVRNDVQAIREGFAAGGDDYVTKPFEKEELLARIRSTLERAVLARDLAELREKFESPEAGAAPDG